MKLKWQGTGLSECAFWINSPFKNNDHENLPIIAVDPKYFRPAEVSTLLGDATKAIKKLGWKSSTTFSQLVKEMTISDLNEQKSKIEK